MTTTPAKKTKYDPAAPEALVRQNAITPFGPHLIKHGSITNGIADLMGSDQDDLIYSDPPWGTGNVNYWQTINQKMTDTPRQELGFNEFLNTLMGFYKTYCKGNVLIEYGQQWREQFIELGAQYGLVHGLTVELLYQSGSKKLPCDLMVFGNGSAPVIPDGFAEAVHHTHGYNTLKTVFRYFTVPGGLVLDPCCGMGYTAQAAIDNGMVFRGNELNAKRLQVTANRLYKATK